MILTWSRRPAAAMPSIVPRHRVEGEREQAGEADDLGAVLADRGDEALDRHVDAEVVDLVAGDLEHHHDDVLADVVDVAVHRAEDDSAALLAVSPAVIRGFSSAAMPFMISPPMMSSGMKTSSQANLSPRVVIAAAGVVEDRLRGFARVQAVLHDLERAVLVHGEDRVGQLGGHAASLFTL